jgi:hypothetical protein
LYAYTTESVEVTYGGYVYLIQVHTLNSFVANHFHA